MMTMNWPVVQQAQAVRTFAAFSTCSTRREPASPSTATLVPLPAPPFARFKPATALVSTASSEARRGRCSLSTSPRVTWATQCARCRARSIREAAGSPWTETSGRKRTAMFQQDTGLNVDGVAGPDTWNALVAGFLASPDVRTAAENVFQAWTQADQNAAAKDATPQAVSELFARTWQSSDGWIFDQCGGALGHVYCTWNGNSEKLILGGNDNTGAPFYFIDSATFQP